jgi:hypothetical protein
MTKAPPVPPQNQSHKGTGDPKNGTGTQAKGGKAQPGNPNERGQAGNMGQNLTHQDHEQNHQGHQKNR